jgi:plasmid stabilization system protein ParE
MSEVRWSQRATTEFIEYLAYLEERNPSVRNVARLDISTRVERLGRRPMIGRSSRWLGLRELTLSRWRKIAVYRVETERVYIVALLDSRRDLTAVNLAE